MNKKTFRYNSILLKLICVILAFFIPVIVSGIVTINLSLKEANEQKRQMLANELVSHMSDIEEEMEFIYTTLSNITVSDTEISQLISKYSSLSAYELGQSVASLHSKISLVKNTSSLIENVIVYSPLIERAFSSKEYYIDQFIPKQSQEFATILENRNFPFINYKGNTYISSPFPINSRKEPVYILYVQLNNRHLEEFLSSENKEFTYSISTISLEDQKHLQESKNVYTPEKKAVEYFDFEKEEEKYIGVRTYCSYLNQQIALWCPESIIPTQKQKTALSLLYMEIFLLLGIVGILFYYSIKINKPIHRLLYGFSQLEKQNFDICLSYKGKDELSDLIHYFNHMAVNLKSVITENYLKDISLKKSELQRLQAQISPHFLYNSFSIISHSINLGDADSAREMTRLLCSYFKFVSQNNMEYETLENEIAFCKIYLQIQHLRFGDRVTVEIMDIPKEYAQLEIPKMTIQPLVENAFKHGLAQVAEGGKICIQFNSLADFLEISIQDNGTGLSEIDAQNLMQALETGSMPGHDGLCNVNNRIKLTFPDSPGIKIKTEKNRYFSVIIYIPLK